MLSVLLFLLPLLPPPPCGAADSEWPTVQTATGPVRGSTAKRGGDRTQFLGIPFAAPPVGGNRFRPPQPSTPWLDTLAADRWPPSCPQLAKGKGKHGTFMGDGDCLYVNVFVPTAHEKPREKLPVMLWLYGGAFVMGDSHEFGWYDGGNLAEAHDVIVVSLNYRVGAFGHFSLPELLAESGTTGNYALQDQRAAMRWVAANIEQFGGDSSRVTIFGESAGAISVCYHYASEASQGLFHAAIMQSGSCDTSSFFQPMELASNYSQAYAERLGCGSRRDDDAAQLLSCLREKSALEVMQAATQWHPFAQRTTTAQMLLEAAAATASASGSVRTPDLGSINTVEEMLAAHRSPLLDPLMPFGPVIDGSPEGLIELPLTTLQRGGFKTAVPLLIGTNKNEGNLFVVAPTEIVPTTLEHRLPVAFPLTARGLNRTLLHFFPGDHVAVAKILSAYTGAGGKLSPEPDVAPHFINKYTSIASAALRDYVFTCGSRRAAKAISQNGGRVFLYEFRHDISHWLDGRLLGGNYHSSDLSFTFDNQFPALLHHFTKKDKEMAQFFGSRWSNLARSLRSPNPQPLPADGTIGASNATAETDPAAANWPVWSAETELHMKLELPVSVGSKLRSELCETVWDMLPA